MLRARADFLPAERYDRGFFLDRVWDYHPGEHVTFLAPTQWGKTTLAQQLINVTATEKLPCVSLVMKPRDSTVRRWAVEQDFRVIRRWPPPAHHSGNMPFAEKPRGWVVWPVSKPRDHYEDTIKIWEQFRNVLTDTYRKGNRIVFADELYGITNELNLEPEVQALYTRGASMGAGVWAATQRPAYVPRNAYSMAEHIFLARDPDRQTQKRYAEIGGQDPHDVFGNVNTLQKYEWLYCRRSDSSMCIVGK